MAKVLINAATGASTVEFCVDNSTRVPVSVISSGLAGAETIAVNVHTGVGFTSYSPEGADVTLTATSKQIAITSYGRFQFVKGVTAGAVTLGVATGRNP